MHFVRNAKSLGLQKGMIRVSQICPAFDLRVAGMVNTPATSISSSGIRIGMNVIEVEQYNPKIISSHRVRTDIPEPKSKKRRAEGKA